MWKMRSTCSRISALTRTASQLAVIQDFHTSSLRRFRSQVQHTTMPTALVFLAEGAEEMETIITVDVLRRAGVDVTLAGLSDSAEEPILCSRKVKIMPDTTVKEALKGKKLYDALVMPGGGGGAELLKKSTAVKEALKEQESRGALIAAVCAAPTALAAHGVAKGKRVTSYPGTESKMEGYQYQQDRVVQDGKLITSRGPGTCFEFALKIAEELTGKEKADKVKAGLLVKDTAPCSDVSSGSSSPPSSVDSRGSNLPTSDSSGN